VTADEAGVAGSDAPRRRGRIARLAGAVTMDATPLRVSPDYRRLWLGMLITQIGTQMTAVVVAIQVFDITDSTFAVGLLGAAALLPMIFGGLYGGSVADAGDRRTTALWTTTALAAVSAVLALHAALDGSAVWLLYLAVAAQAFLFGISQPTRMAMIPKIVGKELLPSANALSQVSWNVGFTLGPLAGGFVVAALDYEIAYAIDAVGFGAVFYAYYRLSPMLPDGETRKAGLRSVLEGLKYLRGRSNLLMTFLVDIVAMVFGMQRALFPALAIVFYLGGASTVGLLAAAPAFGAILGALLSGWFGRVQRQGLAVVVAVLVWGGAMTAFGFTSGMLWLGLLMLALAGAADMVSAVFRNVILQTATPDALRGRLQGVLIAVVAGGPLLGDVRAGGVASIVDLQFAIVSGGILVIVGTLLLCLRYPGFLKYHSDNPQP
jgi:MFS family permease